MRTLVIWSDFQSLPELYIFEGDLRHLDGIVVNCEEEGQEALASEVNFLLYDEEEKSRGLVPIDLSSLGAHSLCDVLQSGEDFVIRCGFAS